MSLPFVDPLLFVGTYSVSSSLPANGYIVIFDKMNTGMIYRTICNDFFANASEKIQFLDAKPVDMNGVILTADAFYTNMKSNAYILDKVCINNCTCSKTANTTKALSVQDSYLILSVKPVYFLGSGWFHIHLLYRPIDLHHSPADTNSPHPQESSIYFWHGSGSGKLADHLIFKIRGWVSRAP